jgi:hypothetical protein
MENESESELLNLTTSLGLTETNTEFNSSYSLKGSLSSSRKYLNYKLKACRSSEDLLAQKLSGKCLPEESHGAEDCVSSADGETLSNNLRSLGNSVTPRSYSGRSVGDFHSRYLDIGQWPDMSTKQQAILKKKYQITKLQTIKKDEIARDLATQLRTTEAKKDTYKKLTHRYANGYHKQKATEQALKEAIGLSNILLEQVHKMEARSSVDTPVFDSSPSILYRRRSDLDISFHMERHK